MHIDRSGRRSARSVVGTTSFPVVPATYDSRTALVVVDVQNDFADPRGSLYVRDGESVVSIVNREAKAARTGGALVVTTQDWHPAVTPHFAKDGGIWPVHCVAESWGAELHPDLDVEGAGRILKGSGGEDGYSGFSMVHPVTGDKSTTGLDETLRSRGIERVVVLGLATDYCVKETALDAVRLGYDTTVILDGVRPVEREPGDGQRAVDAMADAGVALE
jgi:nicotinamidase/pyrazinamidase